MAALVCVGGPLDGREVPRHRIRGAWGWLDPAGRAHTAPGPGRALYVLRGDALTWHGRGARRCGGCGVTVDPDARDEALASCPLCGRRLDALDADSRAILFAVPDPKGPAVQNLPSRSPLAPLRERSIPDCDGCGGPSYSHRPGDAPYAVSPDPRGGAVCSPLCELKVLMRVCDGDYPEQRARRVEAVRAFMVEHEGMPGALAVTYDPHSADPAARELTFTGPVSEVSPYAVTLEDQQSGVTVAFDWPALLDVKVVEW